MTDYAFYLDLDGVMADYEAGIRALGFACDPVLAKQLNRSGTDNPVKRQMHDAIKGTDFYRRLPLLPGAVDIFNRIAEHDPIILTAAPKFGSKGDEHLIDPYWLGAAYNKRRWVEEVLLPEAGLEQMRQQGMWIDADPHARIPIPDDKFICTTSERKQRFMHRKHAKTQVLIDDREQNCQAWADGGGVAFLHDPEHPGITLSLIDWILVLPQETVRPGVFGAAYLAPIGAAS